MFQFQQYGIDSFKIDLLQACTNPTIDEQLILRKSRFLISDIIRKYLINHMPYLEKDPKRSSDIFLAIFIMLKLAEPY